MRTVSVFGAAAAALLVAGDAWGAPAADPVEFSGVYPHLAALSDSNTEAGIGAVVPWAGRLWYVSYVAHKAGGGVGLYQISPDLKMQRCPESIVGTHAGRMIHRESRQLIIGPYLVDEKGNVRVFKDIAENERVTAVMRHLTDPTNKVYLLAMEGNFYEADVHTLETRKLVNLHDELGIVGPCHFKGGYTAQGRVVVANNSYNESDQANGSGQGRLAEWDGKTWAILERTAFCEVTTRNGVDAVPSDTSPLFATGWDRRSVLLKVLTNGTWATYRLPKAIQTYDHAWCTEWPRIRAIAPDTLLLDMHGLYYRMSPGFCAGGAGGLSPLASHLKMTPDFCEWQGRLVFAGDDCSSMGYAHRTGGQPQSNLWFGSLADLRRWGPPSGWGGPWQGDAVKAGVPSDPFLVKGFTRRSLHLGLVAPAVARSRCTGAFEITSLPDALAGLERVTIARGSMDEPGRPYSFRIDKPAVVYLAVQDRGTPTLPAGWERTDLKIEWQHGPTFSDTVYRRRFDAGIVEVPAHDGQDDRKAYGVPHLCFVESAAPGAPAPAVTELPADLQGQVSAPGTAAPTGSVTFTIEIDRDGKGGWKRYRQVRVPAGGYAYQLLPDDLPAAWVRLTADRDCTAFAQFFFGPDDSSRPAAGDPALTAGLPRVDEARPRVQGALLPWADKLWFSSYVTEPAARSGDRPQQEGLQAGGLYALGPDARPVRREESLPGIFANRKMLSDGTLSIGPCLVAADGSVRTFLALKGEHVVSTLRHPKRGKVYFLTEDGRLLEGDCTTLAVTPVVDIPTALGLKDAGLRFKGGHLAGKTLIVAATAPDGRSGVLAEGDGTSWQIVDRAAYGDVANLGSISETVVAAGHDGASAILKVRDGGGQWETLRLPQGSSAYDAAWGSEWPRFREVVTERILLDLDGIFYEMSPLPYARLLRPIATHNRLIGDFCAWRGLLVLAGVEPGAPALHGVCAGNDAALWMGIVDDLWRFGRPSGRGGPWRDTPVQAGKPSDPYLMTDFSDMSVTLRHDAAQPVQFTLEVDPVGLRKSWVPYAKIRVPAGQAVVQRFPAAFSAHWVRVVSDRDCRATAQLTYGK